MRPPEARTFEAAAVLPPRLVEASLAASVLYSLASHAQRQAARHAAVATKTGGNESHRMECSFTPSRFGGVEVVTSRFGNNRDSSRVRLRQGSVAHSSELSRVRLRRGSVGRARELSAVQSTSVAVGKGRKSSQRSALHQGSVEHRRELSPAECITSR